MARKRDVIQIQTDVTTQEEWEQEIAKPGLTVVDVYPDWCGPCISMIGTLKKIKFELGDDTLNYVTARSDDIEALESFRNRCEPLWLFFASGSPVYQMRGAHSPLLARKILEELEIEKKVMAGERERATIQLVCDAPAEVELPEVPAAEDEAEAAAALNARRQRSELRVRRALAPYSVLVIAAAVADRREEVLSVVEARGFTVSVETSRVLTEEEADALLLPPPPELEPVDESTPRPAEGGAEDEAGAAEQGGDPAAQAGPADQADGAGGTEAERRASGGVQAEADGDGVDDAREEEDPEVLARRQAVREKLLEGECTLLALKDSQYNEDTPHRWLTLYLGRSPTPPPDVHTETEVAPPADRGQQGAEPDEAAAEGGEEAPAAEPPEPAEAEPPPAEEGSAEQTEQPEPEPTTDAQLRELLQEDSVGVFSPSTVLGQWAALRRYFPELHRVAPPPAAAPAVRQVAFVVFPGERQQAAEQLTEAGFRVLHSGLDQLIEEVAEQLVASLDGGQSQIPELVAAPVFAAALAGDGGAALSAIANMYPLYLSDGPVQADQDARLVFASWGVEIDSLLTEDGAEGAAAVPQGAAEGAAGEVTDGAVAEETPATGVAAADTPAAADAPELAREE